MKITMDDPQLEKGTEVAILSNLAIVENGGSVDVDDETLALYTAQTGKDAEEAMANSAVLSTTDESPADKRKRFEEEKAKETTTAEAEIAGQDTTEGTATEEPATKKTSSNKS